MNSVETQDDMFIHPNRKYSNAERQRLKYIGRSYIVNINGPISDALMQAVLREKELSSFPASPRNKDEIMNLSMMNIM